MKYMNVSFSFLSLSGSVSLFGAEPIRRGKNELAMGMIFKLTP